MRPFSSFLEDRVDCGLRDRFVDFGFSSTGSNRADGLAVYLNRQSTLVGEEIGKGEHLEIPFLQSVGAVLRWALVERGVPRLLLRELNRVEGCAISLLQKEQIAALVHDA